MDEDEIVSIAAATIAVVVCRRRYARSCWVRPWIAYVNDRNAYTHLVRQMPAHRQSRGPGLAGTGPSVGQSGEHEY